MIGTLLYRLGRAWAILKGDAFAVNKKKRKPFRNIPFSEADKEFINSISIEFLFSEFGEQRVNGGGADFQNNESRLDPSLKTLKEYFPNATYTVYSDFDLKIDGVNLIKTQSPVVDPEHERYGYRTADYFKFLSLNQSDADFKCVLDSDMKVVSSDIIALIHLTKKFGFCVPDNDRQLLRQDMIWSKDAKPIQDESLGLGHSYNQSPMTLWKNDERGNLFYKTCAEIMKNDPSRSSLVMWKTAWKTGIYPYILPKQWCLCEGNEGLGEEVILHVGHKKIKEFYEK